MVTRGFLSSGKTKKSKALPNSMLKNDFSEATQGEFRIKLNSLQPNISEAQEIIYQFFIELVQQSYPDVVLAEFKHLFIEPVPSANAEAIWALKIIIESQNELEFKNLFKRCCYILLNNWVGRRNYQITQDLIELVSNWENYHLPSGNHFQQMRVWLASFVNSQDYQEIKLFVSRYDENRIETNWTERYTSFLLAPQYMDERNPIEQRQAAQKFSKQLKEQFKFELALYTAHAQAADLKDSTFQNPTILGDEVLLLIKNIVARRGLLSYASLAKTFLSQIRDINYKDFKKSLLAYLFHSEKDTPLVKTLKTLLVKKVDNLYETYDSETINNSLILMTCNKVIKLLTLEKVGSPSPVFTLLVAQDNPLTLAVMLLKLVLISPNSRTHLEVCIALLIGHYKRKAPDKCQGFIKFLEICKIALTIYAENVQYNLVKMSNGQTNPNLADLDAYRVFSLHKSPPKKE
ncbi:hypothetical protein [Kamptonema sp. UHCC 0994]|uniref:hypothetical protein n=1 Tax=Kamptonema sp. UHCC 0994 TaxID=3031329 RepID=UPI0023B9D869|nr:hypothetical protein [Kamptonema sp. UHCC 0994]MDF0552828.1 hypothetical protein [Kamptonema sp. UHCC 0994]